MLHSIKLTNFKQHKALTVNFSEGLNVIAGENGAGKSTILKAVLYALFGAAAAGQKNHLATWGSDEKMEVELHATIAGKTLIILRGFDKATIFEGEAILAAGHTPVTKYIEQELGLDAKTFKHLMYAAQGETQALLKMGAADLQRRIEVITKIDGIDKVIKLVGEDLSITAAKLSVLPELEDISGLEADLTRFQSEIVTHQISIRKRESMFKDLEKDLKTKQLEVSEVQEKLKQVRQFMTAESTLKTTLGKIESDMTRHEQTHPESSARALTAQVASITTYLDNKQSDSRALAYTESAKREAEATYTKSHQAIEVLEQLAPHYTTYVRLVSELQGKKAQYLSDSAVLASLESVELDCPTCNRAFDEKAAAEVKYKLVIASDLASNSAIVLKEATRTLKAHEDTYPGLPMFIETLESLKSKRTTAMEQLAKVTTQFAELRETDRERLDKAISEAKRDLANTKFELETTTIWEQKQDVLFHQLTRLLSDLEDLEEVTSGWTEEDLAVLESEVIKLHEDLKTEYEGLSEARYALKTTEASKETCQSHCEAARVAAGKRADLEKDAAERKELQVFLRNNRARFTEEVWNSITEITSAYASEITEGLIRDLTRDANGDFYVQEGEYTVPVYELSGAREAIVGLSLRIALGKAFYGDSSFIMLDEVTAACSEVNAANVAGTLQGLGTQVIMISHRGADVANAANVIFLD